MTAEAERSLTTARTKGTLRAWLEGADPHTAAPPPRTRALHLLERAAAFRLLPGMRGVE